MKIRAGMIDGPVKSRKVVQGFFWGRKFNHRWTRMGKNPRTKSQIPMGADGETEKRERFNHRWTRMGKGKRRFYRRERRERRRKKERDTNFTNLH